MNIPDYTLLQSCGKGAYGQVWLAQSQTNKLVALKYVANSQAGDREFEGLINYSQLPESPHLIRILHLGKLEDGFFYTMELADGLYSQGSYVPETLAERLKRSKRLPVTEVMELAAAMLSALGTLHEAGMVHRDLKPENILYVNGTPKLSDVGLVRSSEQTVSLGGTLGFIPPERLKPGNSAAYNVSDDLYALGKVLYCALTGNAVEKFPSVPPEMINNTLCCHLNQIILKACGNEDDRFKNTGDFLSQLQNGTEQTVKRELPYKKYIFPAISAVLLILMLLITIKWASEFEQQLPEKAAENATASEKKLHSQIQQKTQETTPTKKENQQNTTVDQTKTIPKAPKKDGPEETVDTQKRPRVLQLDAQGGVVRKAGENINWKNLPWDPFEKKKSKKWELEDFGGMYEAFAKNSVELHIREPYIYYHPRQGDGLHRNYKPGELKKGPVYARLLYSSQTMGDRFWNDKYTHNISKDLAGDGKKYGILSMTKDLPNEYVIRFSVSLKPEIATPTLFDFGISTPESPFDGITWKLALFPDRAEVPFCGITFFDQKIISLAFKNPNKTNSIQKKSFIVEVVRTNSIFAIYLDNTLCQYIPSGSPGGILHVDLHSLNTVKIDHWEIYELNPLPPYLPAEHYLTPDRRTVKTDKAPKKQVFSPKQPALPTVKDPEPAKSKEPLQSPPPPRKKTISEAESNQLKLELRRWKDKERVQIEKQKYTDQEKKFMDLIKKADDLKEKHGKKTFIEYSGPTGNTVPAPDLGRIPRRMTKLFPLENAPKDFAYANDNAYAGNLPRNYVIKGYIFFDDRRNQRYLNLHSLHLSFYNIGSNNSYDIDFYIWLSATKGTLLSFQAKDQTGTHTTHLYNHFTNANENYLHRLQEQNHPPREMGIPFELIKMRDNIVLYINDQLIMNVKNENIAEVPSFATDMGGKTFFDPAADNWEIYDITPDPECPPEEAYVLPDQRKKAK